MNVLVRRCINKHHFCPNFRQALEAKAALYDRLRQGVGLREELEGEDGEENEPRFMVDFTKKIWQEVY